MKLHLPHYLYRAGALMAAAAASLAMYAGVTVSFSSIPLRNAFREVEKVSDIRFFYNSNLAGLDHNVSLSVSDASSKELLDALFKGTKLGYSLESNNVVVVFPEKSPTSLQEILVQEGSRQSFGIKGTVTDNTGEPLIGASVKIRGTRVGVVTDINGEYTLPTVSAGEVIDVSYIGYEPQAITINQAGTYNVQLQDQSTALNDVVIVGYGTQKKVNLTGAVSVIKASDINGRPTGNAATAIQGADPALNLTMGSGGPNSGYNLDIRGVASINGGKPLVLVDGVEMDLTRVNANDIESVSVLKDASAAAIYGARASSGVVLVTTKNGRENTQPRINVDIKAGWKDLTASTDFVDSGFWSVQINDMFLKEHAGYGYTTYDDYDYAELWMRLDQYKESAERPWAVVQNDGSYKYYANFNWYNHYFKKNRPMQDYNVSVSGGSDRVNYYVSGRFYAEDGMINIDTDKFQSFSTRAKLDVKIAKWLKYGVNMSFFSSDYNYPGADDQEYFFKKAVLHALPYIPSTNPDGTAVYSNPYNYNGSVKVSDGLNALLLGGKHFNKNINREFVIKNDLQFTLTKDWTINADYSFRFRFYGAQNRRAPISYSSTAGVLTWMDSAENSFARDQFSRRDTYQSDHIYNVYTTWAPSFGKNNIKVMLGMNGEQFHSNSLKVVQLDLLSTELSSFNLATGEVTELNEDRYNWRTLGFFGRFNYDYDNRYLIEVSGRYDGSSRFASNHRWGFFPSASAGWRMGQEKFWEGMRTWWNDAKLRVSVGSLGNQQVGNYDYIQTLSTDKKLSGYTLDGINYIDYATESSPVASDLTWEKVITYDLGLDLSFFNSRLNFTGDVYIRDTKDMLTNGVSLPAVYGASVPKANCANMRTKGYEVGLTWNDNIVLAGDNFRYSIGAGLGDYKSKITKFDNPEKLLTDYYEGMTLGEIWGYRIDGLFPDDETAAAYKVDQTLVNQDIIAVGPSKGLHGGDMKYRDLDGDDVISIGENKVGKSGDREVIGNSLPRYNYNIRLSAEWKGFDLALFFQGIGHRDWYPNTESTTFWGPYSRPYQAFIEKGFLDQVWTYDNPDAYFPRWRGYEALGVNNQLGPANDRYLQNLAYFRLKNLTFGYTIPVFKKYINQLRVYFSGENLFYLSPFKKHCTSIDPETAATNATGNNYGFSRSFTFGVSVTL